MLEFVHFVGSLVPDDIVPVLHVLHPSDSQLRSDGILKSMVLEVLKQRERARTLKLSMDSVSDFGAVPNGFSDSKGAVLEFVGFHGFHGFESFDDSVVAVDALGIEQEQCNGDLHGFEEFECFRTISFLGFVGFVGFAGSEHVDIEVVTR